MARSVSCADNSVHVEYATCDCEDSDDFQWLLEDFQAAILKAFPSATKCDQWLDREDHAIVSNNFANFGVSEYCGLVSMWVAPIDDDYPSSTGLRDRWIDSIEAKFQKIARNSFGQALIKLGSFSNGEAFFQPVNGKQQGDMGLGFSSKCGWL